MSLQPSSYYNILVFGERGVGKSSVINMIAGKDVASVSSDANAGTSAFESSMYNEASQDMPLKFWETEGIDGGASGDLAATTAASYLYDLIQHLKDGVSLLVFCVRGPRVTGNDARNFQIFHEKIFQKRVSIILVLTGLEAEDEIDDWWAKNEHAFQTRGIIPDGHICVVATKGKFREASGEFLYERDYEESKTKLQKLVANTYQKTPWKIAGTSWYETTMDKLSSILPEVYGIRPIAFQKIVSQCIKNKSGIASENNNHVDRRNPC